MSAPGPLRKVFYYAHAVPLSYLLRQALSRLAKRLRPQATVAASVDDESLVAQPGPPPFTAMPGVEIDSAVATTLCAACIEHRFDVLGSAWLSFGYRDSAPGLEEYRYDARMPPFKDDDLSAIVAEEALPVSRRYWRLLRERAPHYAPVDWQRDPVSGFRWNAQIAATKQFSLSRDCPGAEPLRPLNLGRLLHLPRLAILAQCLPERAPVLVREYEAQVLDFMAANPVGWGIQWSVSIDVAVRAANLVLSHWLLQAAGCAELLSAEFETALAVLLQQHGAFLYANLEYNAGNTGNHYLAGLTGLLFVARYFEASQEVLAWEQRGIHGLPRELERQFYRDGGHFEGSSCYHGFCTELLAWCYALFQDRRIDATLPEEFPDRLARAFDLLKTLQTPKGCIPQFGDNDSARLFRLLPCGVMTTRSEAVDRYLHLRHFPGVGESEAYFDENVLDYTDLDKLRRGTSIEGHIYRGTAGATAADALCTVGPELPANPVASQRPALPYTLERCFASEGDLCDGLQRRVFPETGLYVFRSPKLYLALSAHTNAAQKLNLAHNHNDKLGVELYLDGRCLLRDPGSYVYGALPARRDRFRASMAHCVPVVEGLEQNRFVDVFTSYLDARCTLLMLAGNEVLLELRFGAIVICRQITIGAREVCIRDSCNRPFRQNWGMPEEYSPGYGKLEALQ